MHCVCVFVHACACVCERERERERERESQLQHRVCVLVCVREGEKVTQPWLVCKHIRASLLCLSRDSVFTLVLKAEARDYGKGSYISDTACGVRPITIHWVWANQSRLCLSDEGTL